MVKCRLTIAAIKASPITPPQRMMNVFIPEHAATLVSASSGHVAIICPRCANIFTYCRLVKFPRKPIDMNPFPHANSSNFLVGNRRVGLRFGPLPFRSWASPFFVSFPGTDAEPSIQKPPELGPSRLRIKRSIARKASVCLLAVWNLKGEPGVSWDGHSIATASAKA